MINAGILGPCGDAFHDLVGLLLNHPDVTLAGLFVPASDSASGLVSDIFPDLFPEAGELTVSSTMKLDGLDVLFCTDRSLLSPAILEKLRSDSEFRVVVLPGEAGETEAAPLPEDFVYGLPEWNRKAMVRGARAVECPGAVAMALELALLPLARNLMLNSPVHASAVVPAPADSPSSALLPLSHPHAVETSALLSSIQNSFSQPVNLVVHRVPASAGLLMIVYIDTPIALGEIERIYEEAYSDHNFTFLAKSSPCAEAVRGGNKCLMHLDKHGDRLVVTLAADPRMKGAAGNAVHCMNLLFGLHERTGLARGF